MHIRWHRSAWLFKKSGCKSTSKISLALGWRLPRLRSWSVTAATRNATCSTTATCNFTCRWACVSLRFTGPSTSIKAPWMEPYIRMNTEFRKQATSDFVRDLQAPGLFSPWEDDGEPQKRVDVKLVRAREQA